MDPATALVFAAAFVAIAVVTVRRPVYGIVALVCCIPFGLPHEVGHTTLTLDKVALLALVAGLVLGRRDPRTLGAPAVRTIALCGLAVVLATALSIANAQFREPVLRETLKAAQYLALFAAAAIAFAADSGERPIRWALIGIMVLVAVLALAQEVTGAPSGLWFSGSPIPRIAGPLEGPNQLSAYLGILLAFATAFALRRDERRLTYAALALASAALVLTISRSGVVASLAGAGVVLAVSKGTQRRGAMLAIAAGGLAGGAVIALWGFAAKHAVAGVAILGRFGSTAETADAGNVGTRAQLWHAAILLWRTHPLLGIGAGNFELDLGRAGYPLLHTHANSLFLQSLAEGGIPLLLATLALVIVSIAAFARGPFSDPLVAGAFGASIGLAAHQLVDLLVFYPKVGEMWWIALALAAVRVAGPGRHAVPP